MNEFHVKYISKNSELTKPPFIVQCDLPKDINFSMYRHKHADRRPNSRMLIGQFNNEQYVCTLERTLPINYALGVVDPTNSTITVHDLPFLSVTSQKIEDTTEEFTLSTTSDPISIFGSKRSKRVVNNIEKRKAQKPAIEYAEKALQSNTYIDKQIKEITASKETHVDSRLSILPFFNPEGTNMETFYPFEEFIPQDLIKFCKPTFLSDYPSQFTWIRERFTNFNQKDSKLVQKLFQLTLMHYMLTFANLSNYQLSKLSKSKDMHSNSSINLPSPILNYFLTTFTDSKKGKIQASTSTTLRMYCHICVLALWIEGISGVSIVQFAQELSNLTLSRLEKIFKQVGCVIRKKKEGGNMISYAILQFPPIFPR